MEKSNIFVPKSFYLETRKIKDCNVLQVFKKFNKSNLLKIAASQQFNLNTLTNEDFSKNKDIKKIKDYSSFSLLSTHHKKFLPLNFIFSQNDYAVYLCRKCFKVNGSYYYDLRKGKRDFCSCECDFSTSKGSSIIENYLKSKSNIIDYEKEWTHELLINSKTNRFFRIDFVIYKKHTKEILAFIEFDGKQHYKFTPVWHETIENFQSLQERDKLKESICCNLYPNAKFLRILDLESDRKNTLNIEKKLNKLFIELEGEI